MEPLTKGDEKQSLEKDIKAEPTGFAINVGVMDTWHLKADVITGTRKAIVLSSEVFWIFKIHGKVVFTSTANWVTLNLTVIENKDKAI